MVGVRQWPPMVMALMVALAASACVAARRPADLAARAAGHHVVLAVATWNLHAGRGDLPRFLDDLTQGRLTGSPVRDYALLLQENITGGQYDAMAVAKARHLWAYATPVRESSRGTSGNAIVTTRQPLSARTIDLPRERRVRKAIAAVFEIDGTPLFIVNAHLENRTSWLKTALFSDSARQRQAQALLREMPPGPGVVGGDLNTWLGEAEPALRALAQRFPDGPDDTLAPTFRDKLVLDHLFFDLPDGWDAVRRTVPERYGSDHHPVIGLIITSRGRS